MISTNKENGPKVHWTPLVLGITVFLFYLSTLSPSVLWGDSAKLTEFVHERVLSVRQEYHPLHTLAGILFNALPFGDTVFRLNLMSAFFGSVTVVLTYFIILCLTGSITGSVAGAISLAVSHVSGISRL